MRGREINHQEGVRGREKGSHLVKNSWSSGVLLEVLLLHLLPPDPVSEEPLSSEDTVTWPSSPEYYGKELPHNHRKRI